MENREGEEGVAATYAPTVHDRIWRTPPLAAGRPIYENDLLEGRMDAPRPYAARWGILSFFVFYKIISKRIDTDPPRPRILKPCASASADREFGKFFDQFVYRGVGVIELAYDWRAEANDSAGGNETLVLNVQQTQAGYDAYDVRLTVEWRSEDGEPSRRDLRPRPDGGKRFGFRSTRRRARSRSIPTSGCPRQSRSDRKIIDEFEDLRLSFRRASRSRRSGAGATQGARVGRVARKTGRGDRRAVYRRRPVRLFGSNIDAFSPKDIFGRLRRWRISSSGAFASAT